MADTRKPLKDLNLIDRFLFAEAMEDPLIMQYMLEIMLDKEVVLRQLPQSEKEVRLSNLWRSIRLDVWGWDMEDTIYDAEVQQMNSRNLPKRSRLYQALIDAKLLQPGEIDFNRLNMVYVILIMPFDLFGHGLYRYTFEQQCKEVPGLRLGDDAVRIFYNTRGRNDCEVSPELVEFLHYMEHTTGEVSQRCKSQRIKAMQERIEAIKSNEEIGVKYMQAWEERELDRREFYALGRAESIIELLEELGTLPEEIRTLVYEQRDLDVLKEWNKMAARANTIEEFEEKIERKHISD